MICRQSTLHKLLAAGFLTFLGCQPSHLGEVGIAPKGIIVAAISPAMLDIPSPNVQLGWQLVTVSGRVHRKPGFDQPIFGRIDVDFLDPTGKPITWLPVLTPDPVPTEINGEAGYTASYGITLPKGSTVRVHFVDRQTAAQEDATHTESPLDPSLAAAQPAVSSVEPRVGLVTAQTEKPTAN